MRYDADGVVVPDVSYTYAEAVADGICRPVAFVTFDGTLSWRSGDDVIESSFETVLSSREASRRYRTAISTELPDGLPRILREADAKLRALRDEGHRDAGGLAVAADATHARRIAKLLGEATGRAPVVVLHTEANAAQKLADFRGSRDPWIVAVNMVSEGVDIPRLRVGVYASAAKTPLIFRQIVGRFVRTIPGMDARAELGVPAGRPDAARATPPRSRASCATRCAASEDEEGLDEPRERRATEPVAGDGVRAAERRVRRADDAVRARAHAEREHRRPGPPPAASVARGGVRAPREPAPGAQPPGRGPAPPRRAQPPRDQRVGQPRGGSRSASSRRASSSWSARSQALVRELTRRSRRAAAG